MKKNILFLTFSALVLTGCSLSFGLPATSPITRLESSKPQSSTGSKITLETFAEESKTIVNTLLSDLDNLKLTLDINKAYYEQNHFDYINDKIVPTMTGVLGGKGELTAVVNNFKDADPSKAIAAAYIKDGQYTYKSVYDEGYPYEVENLIYEGKSIDGYAYYQNGMSYFDGSDDGLKELLTTIFGLNVSTTPDLLKIDTPFSKENFLSVHDFVDQLKEMLLSNDNLYSYFKFADSYKPGLIEYYSYEEGGVSAEINVNQAVYDAFKNDKSVQEKIPNIEHIDLTIVGDNSISIYANPNTKRLELSFDVDVDDVSVDGSEYFKISDIDLDLDLIIDTNQYTCPTPKNPEKYINIQDIWEEMEK